MSEKCYRCFRPLSSCYCGDIVPLRTGVKFVFLMHPKEARRQKTGTGRLASLSLLDSEIIEGIDFTDNARLMTLLADPAYAPFLLYPAEDAYHTDMPSFRKRIGTKVPLVIVIDATWFFAKKMVQASKNLHGLPALSFGAPYRSGFEFKKQPHPSCLSTIESAYYLVNELRAAGIANPDADPEPLMAVFRRMIDFQLACEQARHEAEAALIYPDLFSRGPKVQNESPAR